MTDFLKFGPHVEKIDFECVPGSQKWPKSVILRKTEKLLLRPARELIFLLKYSYLNVLTGKNHPRPGNKSYVEKIDLKLTKNRFFQHGFVTTFRKSHFSTLNIGKN